MLVAIIVLFLFVLVLFIFEPERFGGLMLWALRFYSIVVLFVSFFLFVFIFKGGIELAGRSLAQARAFYEALEAVGAASDSASPPEDAPEKSPEHNRASR